MGGKNLIVANRIFGAHSLIHFRRSTTHFEAEKILSLIKATDFRWKQNYAKKFHVAAKKRIFVQNMVTLSVKLGFHWITAI